MKKEILKLHADFRKVFSNPMRLEMCCLLRDGELTAGEITEKLCIRKANTSSIWHSCGCRIF